MDKQEPIIAGATITLRVLVVLWIPSADRDGKDLPDQQKWIDSALELFADLYGGATAMPPAQGIWRDDERGGQIVRESPVLVHCYVPSEEVNDRNKLGRLGAFCKKMGKETRQGEVVLLVHEWWVSIKNFS